MTAAPDPSGRREPDLVLRYEGPARRWTDALPLGNGRIGAMCFGGVATDLIQLNDDRCWSGSPQTAHGTPLLAPGEGPEVVRRVREALFADDVRAAEREITRIQHGHTQAYQPLADLRLVQEGPTIAQEHQRGLDLREAVASHSWTQGSVRVDQDAWVSAPAAALVVDRRATAVRPPPPRPDLTPQPGADLTPPPGAGSARLPTTSVQLASPHPGPVEAWVEGAGRSVGHLRLTVRMPSHVVPTHEDLPEPVLRDLTPGAAVTALVQLCLVTDGQVTVEDGALRVVGATRLTLALATETDYTDPLTAPHGDVERIRTVLADRVAGLSRRLAGGSRVLREEHVGDHDRLFGRVELRLGDGDPLTAGSPAGLPTDVRVRRHAEGAADPGLAALAFQYGRYLLTSASRPGTLPATLQGIWNAKVRPPWSSNYTTNVNLEMNYWSANVANLSECAEPLITWMGYAAQTGAQAARGLYGLDGWVLHHNSDAWAFALPAGEGDADPCWSAWPMGSVWLARHVWDHYDFTRDLDLLERTGWPLVREAGRFALGWLVELPDGTLGTAPSTSPENHFTAPDGAPAAVGISTTADLVLVTDLLERGLEMLDALAGRGVDDVPWRTQAQAALARLPGERVGPDGRLAEWSDDPDEPEPGHRHTTHLVGVYPGSRIDPVTAPKLAAAARRTLDARGPRSTGWALAWRLALRARLLDLDGAAAALRAFLAPMPDDASQEPSIDTPAGVYRNLFCAHPPFQIDGNFGVVAGLAELLLQSHRTTAELTVIDLIPVPLWPAGELRGLRARGGVQVDARWSKGVLEHVRLVADADRRVRVCGPGLGVRVVELVAGEPVTVL